MFNMFFNDMKNQYNDKYNGQLKILVFFSKQRILKQSPKNKVKFSI